MRARTALAIGLFGAAVSWTTQAGAASYTATYNIPTDGYVIGGVVNHFEGPGKTNTDTITVNLVGPGFVEPGTAGTVSLNISMGPFKLAGFSSFSWVWQSDNALTNISGTFSTSAQNTIALPFTATTIPGAVYSSYHLYITSTTNGLAGGGYVYTLGTAPCPECAPPPPGVPVPPAAALFVTGLAGLGWLARGRRKQAA
jgi:hypothetical protein